MSRIEHKAGAGSIQHGAACTGFAINQQRGRCLKHLARFLFENSPWGPFWTAWSVGYVIVGPDGQVYLTDAGAEYLEGR